MSPRLLAATVCAALVTVLSPGVAEADHSWRGFHWARTSNPFTLQLGDNLDPAWDGHLATTSADWSKSTVLDTAIVAGSAEGKSCQPVIGRVEVCNLMKGNNGWLGIAQIWITSGRHIVQGRVIVNDYYYGFPFYDTAAWRNIVMCQEVGHTLGLDHQDEDFFNKNLNTCMDYTAEPESNQHPNAHDYAQLREIYRHLDSTTTVGAGAPSSGAGVGAHKSSWGRLVAGSRAAGHSTYVRDAGGGDLAVTRVIWAR